ncbi:MAG: flagellar protein FlaG, partial [Gammaproteobacteria bacterium]|nr:flagellar protein FlaG [Gammaproteobacteria bacterium]
MDIDIPNRVISTGKIDSQNQSNLKLLNARENTGASGTNTSENKDVKQSQQDVTQQLENSVSQLNELVQSVHRDLHFSIDEFSGDTVIQVLDTKTEEVIRQIPSEEVLAMARNIETMKGVLFSAE